jgi:predicted phage gp36 major capsid-like protein
MEENKLAVESGLRTEIAEDFMGKLKDLFVESYIEVPESKVDLVDELAEQVEELEEKLNAQTANVLEMSEELENHQREAIIREAARDLAETQVEKLNSLVESLDFEDEESFAHKVKTVKESYFKKEVTQEEEINEDWDATPSRRSVCNGYVP